MSANVRLFSHLSRPIESAIKVDESAKLGSFNLKANNFKNCQVLK